MRRVANLCSRPQTRTPANKRGLRKAIAKLAGVDVKRVAGHSTRIGVAHDLRAFGASDSEIMEAAGWTSLASLLRYLRGRNAEEVR
jgi:hypothetical protein